MRRWWTYVAGVCVLITMAGCIAVDLGSLLTRQLQEVEVSRDKGWGVSDKILLVDVSGVIGNQGGGGWSGVDVCTPDYMAAVLRKAKHDEHVKAVVLRINSPGGEASAADTISHQIDQFVKETQRPVYAVITGLGCSGGYHVACSAERIFVHPSSITGSIGVILVLPKITKLAEKIGLEQTVIKSGDMKDMGNMLRDMTPQERKVFQSMIEDLYHQFLDRVVKRRAAFKSRDQLRPLADGRIYTAAQAVDAKLVDQIGHVDHVLRSARVAAGVEKARIVMYRYRNGGDATIYSPLDKAAVPDITGLRGALPTRLTTRTGFHYLWEPGL